MSTKRQLVLGAVAGAIVIIGLALLIPNLIRCREKAQRIRCLENMNTIFKAMSPWAFYPGQTNSFADPSVFICPCTGHKPGSLTNVLEWTDYVINTNPVGDADDILIYCPPVNHNNEGANVLKVSGVGLWCNKADFDRLVKRKMK